MLAAEQINAAGGVLGRKLEILSRDDAGQPATALSLAAELLDDQKVDILAGGYLSNVGLALADYAASRQALYVAGEPLTDALVWDKGNRFTYRLRPSTYMQAAMLLPDAAKLPARRWATVAPNYEYGQSAVKWFKQLLSAARPDVTFVADQLPALGHIDAPATVAALADAKPDAIFNVTFGADLTAFVRAGNSRGLFDGCSVVSLLTGEPEYLATLGEETPAGWIVTGYPWDQDTAAPNAEFVAAYRARFNEPPRMGSVVGHALVSAIAAGISKTGRLGGPALADGFGGATFNTPFGPCGWRALDHQSTLGTYVGKLAVANGQGRMVDWHYANGAAALPPDEMVRKLRPA
jgi:branched-chain amino acid transport system substrate-binding protein